MIEIRTGIFGDEIFAACFAIRWTVFVEEQNVPAHEERDAEDQAAVHFLALIDDTPVATARATHRSPHLVKLSRVAVLKPFRGQGLGEALMTAAHNAYPGTDFTLNAQLHALPFYQRLGYQAEGAAFDEAGIAHRHMVRLSSSSR
ncbi:GNAT family N-acetyltransferase [Acidocella sp.]|uniref:GNAT family N-acetyltransferase n=1 Tax=Acidocella sp. TaxID=50710 RepID=UPI002627D76D|nr:GNAT family N-acetyltransferase [Acidocella sp.]